MSKKNDAVQHTAQEKMKVVKDYILNEEGDLVHTLFEVPMSDPRPAYNPAKDKSKKEVLGQGNPLKSASEGVIASFNGGLE